MHISGSNAQPRARAGRVTYHGDGYAPTPGTYPTIDPLRIAFTTVADSGLLPTTPELRALTPLVAALLFDVGFSWELGPLTTWNN